MSVKVKYSLSTKFPVLSGVPQGSVLGPILFLIFVNHICKDLSCKFMMFADDLKIYFKIKLNNSNTSQDSTSPTHQRNIDALAQTASSWGLNMNSQKCVTLRFSRVKSISNPVYTLNNTLIPILNCQTDLGVSIDTDLKFHSHTSLTASKAGALVGNLLKCTLCREPEFMKSLYISNVRPVIDYCSPVWNSGYIHNLKLLEQVQRRFTKHIDGLKHLSYAERLATLNLFSVKGRLLSSDLIKCWKIFHKQSSLKYSDFFTLAPLSYLRGHSFKIFTPNVNTDIRKRSFAYRIINIWNSLSQETVNATSIETFKHNLHHELGDRLYDYHN